MSGEWPRSCAPPSGLGRVPRRALLVAVFVVLGLFGQGCGVALSLSGSGPKGGDPSGRLMARLAPLVRVVPGFETGRIPWISFPCDSCKWPARYAIKIEPRWDSCDGIKGTFGWDPALVQIGFQWSGPAQRLVELLNSRLAVRRWGTGAVPVWGNAGVANWDYPRAGVAQEAFALEPPIEGPVKSDHWMAFVEARPEGPLVSGC
jgi:hypothetical protein